jgi:hypothetical protein
VYLLERYCTRDCYYCGVQGSLAQPVMTQVLVQNMAGGGGQTFLQQNFRYFQSNDDCSGRLLYVPPHKIKLFSVIFAYRSGFHLNQFYCEQTIISKILKQYERTEWQWPLSCVHSIMMVKSAQPVEGGDSAASPFHSYLPSRAKLRCALQPRGQIHYPYFSSIPRCTPWAYLEWYGWLTWH